MQTADLRAVVDNDFDENEKNRRINPRTILVALRFLASVLHPHTGCRARVRTHTCCTHSLSFDCSLSRAQKKGYFGVFSFTCAHDVRLLTGVFLVVLLLVLLAHTSLSTIQQARTKRTRSFSGDYPAGSPSALRCSTALTADRLLLLRR